MNSRPRTALTSVTALSALGLLAGAVLPVQAEEPVHYVALGDSFSAGTGTRDKADDCYRSPHGYPALLADAHGLQLDYQACPGADTADVHRDQLGTLSPATDYVTMTIGGHDLGYAGVITQCALPGWLSNCQGRINGATDQLADVIADRTQAAGFRYVDARPAFQGHAVCDSPEWVNGLSWPIQESYHPNREGNIGYADILWPGTFGSTTTPITTDTGAQVTDGAAVSRAQQVRAQADAVLAMDLTGSANLRQARSAGVPTGEVVRLVAQLRSGDAGTVEKALAGLAALDQQHAIRAGR